MVASDGILVINFATFEALFIEHVLESPLRHPSFGRVTRTPNGP